jgi:hypothetical protein
MDPRIFISFSAQDRDLAADLEARLRHVAPATILVTAETEPGQDWSARLRSQLEKSDQILVLLTSNSLHSSNVLLVVGAGASLQKKIVPVVVGLDEAQLPGWVKERQFVKYSELNKYLPALAMAAGNEAAPVQGEPAKAGIT